ncbi:unnamed protein product, partial [Ectocarpus sp. 12 AP-2014]
PPFICSDSTLDVVDSRGHRLTSPERRDSSEIDPKGRQPNRNKRQCVACFGGCGDVRVACCCHGAAGTVAVSCVGGVTAAVTVSPFPSPFWRPCCCKDHFRQEYDIVVASPSYQ